jgi:hypothetical protein
MIDEVQRKKITVLIMYRRKYCSWQNVKYLNLIEGLNFLVPGDIWRGHTDPMRILLNCNALQYLKNF